jgi:FixJ family two-component response regulator
MPAKAQEAFVMRRIEGLSQREISTRMAISENTVEKHISRGSNFWPIGLAMAEKLWHKPLGTGIGDLSPRWRT